MTLWAISPKTACGQPCSVDTFRGDVIYHCEKQPHDVGSHAVRLDAFGAVVLSWPATVEVSP